MSWVQFLYHEVGKVITRSRMIGLADSRKVYEL